MDSTGETLSWSVSPTQLSSLTDSPPQCSEQVQDTKGNAGGGNGCAVTDATVQTCVAGVVPEPGLTATLELSAPSPNPAVDGTHLRYSLPFASFVRLSVLDVAGRQVAVLARHVEGPGAHSVTWDGRDPGGRRARAGLYFVRLESAGQTLSQKIVLDR